jgi:phosphoribosyl-ATP pyrophosphohydrolase
LYHILVALAYYGVDLQEVYQVLEARRNWPTNRSFVV